MEYTTRQLQRMRRNLWKEFEARGGRGVQLAEEIDTIDSELQDRRSGKGKRKSPLSGPKVSQ